MQGDPTPAAERATADVRKALLSSRNTDGGWGYYPGKASRLEPTAWALLALNEPPAALKNWRLQGSWRVDVAGAPVNYAFQALAGLVLLQHAEYAPDASAIARNLLDIKGVSFAADGRDPAGQQPAGLAMDRRHLQLGGADRARPAPY